MTRRAGVVVGVVASVLVAPTPSAGRDGVAAGGSGASDARIIVSDADALIDEPVDITVKGLEPRQRVSLRLSMSRAGGEWESQASFTADGSGRVRVSRTAPVDGDYRGLDAMGLFWSAAPPAASALSRGSDLPPDTVVITAEVDGQPVTSTTLVRRFLPPAVEIRDVREDGVVGELYVPPGRRRHPAVVVLGGSEGGVPSALAAGLASHGYVALALAYFDPTGQLPGLPRALASVPLEYFDAAVEWLQAQPRVNDARIGIVGGSRGAEAALLVASARADLEAVVAYAPSHVAWPDLAGAGPAWTRGGEPVPYVPARPGSGAPIDAFRAGLQDRSAVRRAAIPVERIGGAVLLISGEDDQLWPSSDMADHVIARLRRNDHRHPYRHLSYPDAGHVIIRPYQPTTTLAVGARFPLGGQPAGAAEAAADHWPRVLRFLAENL